jgi:hypothetical protein
MLRHYNTRELRAELQRRKSLRRVRPKTKSPPPKPAPKGGR